MAQTQALAQEKSSRKLGSWILIGIFALFFAYDVWEGIGNFLGIQAQSFTLGIGISSFGWLAIVIGILAPIALFLGALLVTRSKALGPTLAIFFVALTVSAVIGVDLALGTNAFLVFSVS
jgi:hypothetical protein